jgi:signal transduction histidine kinase
MLVPVKTRDSTIGVLGLFQAESGRRYTEQDLAFAEEIARRAAIAIENARLYAQTMRAVGIRDQFLSIASHELRTPLTSLMLQLSSLSRAAKAGQLGSMSTEKLGGRIVRMEQQAIRLTALVDELLDVSRLSTGRLTLNAERGDLVGIVREVLERLSDEAERAKSPLRSTAPTSVMGVWDRNRLDQVLTNLIDNAIKYAPGKPIDVEVRELGTSVSVTVRDQGPGIARADQSRIFAQFERAAPPSLSGLGLGLWLASRIVEAHGGRIEVASDIGEGASFTLHLPLMP